MLLNLNFLFMKKLLFITIVGICLLTACTSVELPIVNVDSLSLEVGDSAYISVRNTPKNKAYFDMQSSKNPICTIKELSDTSAMVYAIKTGEDFFRIYYTADRFATTVSYPIYIPTVVSAKKDSTTMQK